MDFIKIKNFCPIKYPVEEMRDMPQTMRKYREIFDRETLSKVYQELLKLNNK